MENRFKTKYNEPLTKYKDQFPKAHATTKVSDLVMSRLELESTLKVCGLTKTKNLPKFTKNHKLVLQKMLFEKSSPKEMSLRARALQVAGLIGLNEVLPDLKVILRDKNENLQTRISALNSICTLEKGEFVEVIKDVMKFKSMPLKVAVLKRGLNSQSKKVNDYSHKILLEDKNEKLKNVMLKKSKIFKKIHSTIKD